MPKCDVLLEEVTGSLRFSDAALSVSVEDNFD